MRFVRFLVCAGLACSACGVSLADDLVRIAALLAPAVERGGSVTIPPGDYKLDGDRPLPIPSRTTVFAYGARFHFPRHLGDKARRILFAGRDVVQFAWHGGEFFGHVFDPDRRENSYEPNVSTRAFVITTSAEGMTTDILFRDVRADGVAGAVINVQGLAKTGSESGVVRFAERIVVENCTLLRSGKFMWDYGYLWHLLTWTEDFESWEVERARRYFRVDRLRNDVEMQDGDDRVRFDNRAAAIPVSPNDDPPHALAFFGAALPRNIVRGRQYFVVATGPDHIRISDRPGGAPIRFQGGSGPGAAFVHDLFVAYRTAYDPLGSAPGKGGVDIQCARDVRITGCQLSALGDTMHVQRCHNVIFNGNHILGSRMGAFYLASFCKNATINGNLVDGTNGSRVMSVEKSCEDVTIVGNTFRNGGRGSWINQPRNFILSGNVFVNNTTKNEPNPRRGRRSFLTGGWEQKPELYFTLYEPGAHYGPVVVSDNIFVLGEACGDPAMTFAANGRDVRVVGNTFRNHAAIIRVDPSCEAVAVHDNAGATVQRDPVSFQHGRQEQPVLGVSPAQVRP
jgi:hypothetical protein